MYTYYYLVSNNKIQPNIYLHKDHNNHSYYLNQNQNLIKSFTSNHEVYVDEVVFIEHTNQIIKDIHTTEPDNLDYKHCYSTITQHNVYNAFDQ